MSTSKQHGGYIDDLTVSSQYPYIVYGSVRGLVSEHHTFKGALYSLAQDQRGCRSQGGYSDAMVYERCEGGWTLRGYSADEYRCVQAEGELIDRMLAEQEREDQQ